MSSPEPVTGFYKVEGSALVSCQGTDEGALSVNWSVADNIDLAKMFGLGVLLIAAARPAEACVEVENFFGKVGLTGRVIPAEAGEVASAGKTNAKGKGKSKVVAKGDITKGE